MEMHSTLMIDFEDTALAKKFYYMLLPEAKTTKAKAAKALLELDGSRLMVRIEAPTIASLRALLNSYIRWVSTSLEVVNLKGD